MIKAVVFTFACVCLLAQSAFAQQPKFDHDAYCPGAQANIFCQAGPNVLQNVDARYRVEEVVVCSGPQGLYMRVTNDKGLSAPLPVTATRRMGITNYIYENDALNLVLNLSHNARTGESNLQWAQANVQTMKPINVPYVCSLN